MILRRPLFLVFLSLAVSMTTASGQKTEAPDLNSLSDSDLKALTISFERTQCYGTCPSYTIAIHGDGSVTYIGKEHVKIKENREGRIEPKALRTLLSEFAKAKFLSLPEDYSESKCACRRCTDMATAITELKTTNVTHRVNHYYGCGCAPKALFELESAIDKAANVEQWTGDVSKQGPFGTTCFG